VTDLQLEDPARVAAHVPLYADPVVHARRWWILAVLNLSLLIVFIGNSSLNVAIPTLSKELSASNTQIQWVIASYSLVFAGLLFSSGALGDRFGRKGALQLGLVIYLVACIAATGSQSMPQLIACRALMGVGAAFIMPSTLSILVNVFSPAERARAISVWASITGAAGAIGPVASGWLIGHFWYGSVFLVNVPILAVALVAGHVLLPKSRDDKHIRLDPVGSILSAIGIVLIVYGLIEAPASGWASGSTIGFFTAGVAVLIVFGWWELRSDHPMLDIRYFRIPAFSTGTGGMVLVFMAMYGTMLLLTQYFQLVLDYTPLEAAVRFLPMAPIMLYVAPRTPALSRRYGSHRVVTCGMLSVAFGLFVFRGLGPDTGYLYLLCGLLPLVVGMALAMAPMTAAIMSAVPPNRAGAGSAMNDATRELGAGLGIAVMGSIANSQYADHIDELTRGLPESVASAARTSLADAIDAAQHLPHAAREALTVGAQHAFIDAIHVTVSIGGVLAVIAAAAVYRFLPRDLTTDDAELHGGHVDDGIEPFAEVSVAGLDV
jgi:EmrB/QacA subfamily drug resistance transporter